MESIYSLLALPKPLNNDNGKIQAKAVLTFNQGRKRKRNEIAAGIDGDSLNICNIQPASLLHTHAVPPHLRFTSPPCSIYSGIKRLKSESRRTYVTTVDDFEDKAVLSCFEDHRTGLEPPTSKRSEYKLTSESDILALDAIQSSSSLSSKDTGHEILIAHRDGTVQSLPPDLSQPLWSTNIASSYGSIDLLNVTVTNAQALKSGLLRNRGDASAQLSAGNNDDSQLERRPAVVIIGRRDSQTLSVLFFFIRSRQPLHFGSQQPLELLLELSLPLQLNDADSQSLHCEWSLSTGVLHLLCAGQTISFDCTGYAPRQVSSIKSLSGGVLNHYATDSSLIFTQESNQVTLYDTKYGSIQDRRIIPSHSNASGRQRKREQEELDTFPILFVDHFPKLSLVLAAHKNNLLALQLSKNVNRQIRGKQESRLVDSLHRGVAGQPASDLETGYLLGGNLKIEEWSNRRQELVGLADDNDTAAFDRVFGALVGAKSMSSKAGDAVEWSWDESDQRLRTAKHHPLAIFALECVFGFYRSRSTDSEDKPSQVLKIEFFPSNTFRWLTETGQLSFANIQQALLHFPSHPSLDLNRQDAMDAIAQLDPSLNVLCDVVRHSPHLDIIELVQCMKHIIASFDDKGLPAPHALIAGDSEMLAITNGEIADIPNGFHVNGDIPNGFDGPDTAETEVLVNGDVDHEMDAVVESAIEDVDMVLDDLQSDQSRRGEALSKCLTRLNAHSSDNTTRALQQGLSQHEIIFLIHLLRVELAEGGWLSRYFDSPTDDDKYVYNQSALVVLNLINCALDAIGISGFLAASAEDPSDSIDDLLSSLQAEHAAVMEGLNEAQFVNGALNTFLGFAGRLSRSQFHSADKAIRISKPDSNELPLGLKIDEISRTRRNGGGQVIRRSKRDIGRQISMQVPLYSVERIRI